MFCVLSYLLYRMFISGLHGSRVLSVGASVQKQFDVTVTLSE